jgi:hypothetical protein
MSLWLAGYPKTPSFDPQFGSNCDIAEWSRHFRNDFNSGHFVASH